MLLNFLLRLQQGTKTWRMMADQGGSTNGVYIELSCGHTEHCRNNSTQSDQD